MDNYIDGFVFPIPRIHLDEYKAIAEKVAEIWREYGALAYLEYVAEDLNLEGTRSFSEAVDLKEGEAIVFGWVTFPSKAVRDKANREVPTDPRMAKLVAPLSDPKRMIFDAERMFYGGFQPFIRWKSKEVGK